MKAVLRFISAAAALSIILASTLSCFAAFTPNSKSVNSEAVYMMNLDTGKVIYTQNEDKQMYPASLVKIMVAVMAIEQVENPKKTMVTARPYIFDELYGKDASTADIRHDEKLSMLDLLYALMLPSACEAGSIIADYLGNGSIEDFVESMNKRAKQLGCTNTNFVNAHGLHHPDQYTTAHDMAIITQYALTLPLFEKISTTYQYTMAKTNKHPEPRNIYHTNTMMANSGDNRYYYPYIKGIKTGTTDQSGKNLVSIAQKDGYTYLLVTMHAPVQYDDGSYISDNLCFIDTANLYNWAFENFAVKTIASSDETISDVKVELSFDTDHVLLTPEKDVTALIPSSVDISSVQKIADIPESINAPVKKGDKVGTLTLKLADEVIGTVPLVASQDVEQNMLLVILNAIGEFFTSTLFIVILIIIVVLIIAYIFFIIAYNKKRRNRLRRTVKKRRPPKRRYR